ncbi:MAG: bacterio-opsin activator, partial [Sulfuracidifex metallicus]|nr:bacterio-opsin activator [Sulfuracidifex metallicus]
MGYSKYSYKMVNLRLLHNDCWTSHMDGHVVKSLGRSFDHSDNGLRALVVVSSSSMKTLKSLMDEGKIKDIVNVQRYSDKFIVDIVQEYNNSVLSI